MDSEEIIDADYYSEEATQELEGSFIPLEQAAREYGVLRTTLFLHFSRGTIEGAKINGKLRLRRTSIEQAFNAAMPTATQHLTPSPRRATSALSATDATTRGVEDRSRLLPRRRTSETHELALRLDTLHKDLRRTERENHALRFELLRCRLALDDSERRLHKSDTRKKKTDMPAVTELHAQLDSEVRTRRQAEQTAVALAEEVELAKQQAKMADWRARCADQEAELARKNACILREQLEGERQRPWWQKLLGQWSA